MGRNWPADVHSSSVVSYELEEVVTDNGPEAEGVNVYQATPGMPTFVAPNEPFRPGIGSATAEPGVVPPGISPAACAAPGTTPTRASARTAVTPRERKNDGRDAEMVAMTGLPSRRGVRPGVDALWAIPAHPRPRSSPRHDRVANFTRTAHHGPARPCLCRSAPWVRCPAPPRRPSAGMPIGPPPLPPHAPLR